MKTQTELAYDKHERWLEIVKTFGNIKDTEAEDLVQTMYLLLIKNTQKGIDFTYGENDVNYWYIFKILKGLHIDLIRKKSKVKLIELDGVDVTQEETVNYEAKYLEVQAALKDMYWYDAKVYKIIEEGESVSELSRKTNISYYSLYNTFRRVKEKLKQYL